MDLRKEHYIQVSGRLFTAVQSSGTFKDSKTFVDSIPKSNPKLINELYKSERIKSSFNLKTFVRSHFEVPSEIQEKLILTEDRNMHEHIKKTFVRSHFEVPSEIQEKLILTEDRNMHEHIKILWDVLKRDALSNINEHSTLIPIPKPYIIPGGRFREIYYWDSYFTMHGLLADGELETVENMIDNFSYLIDEVGFIPNGNRVYYITRSQPPFFAAMIDLVCRFNKDYNWGLKYLSQLEKEYQFWCGDDSNHIIKLQDGIKVLCSFMLERASLFKTSQSILMCSCIFRSSVRINFSWISDGTSKCERTKV
ncbi:MAG: trehalase family glycosidase, partial [Ignavibacteriaceae bacterium]